jgi:hypothetical protein
VFIILAAAMAVATGARDWRIDVDESDKSRNVEGRQACVVAKVQRGYL